MRKVAPNLFLTFLIAVIIVLAVKIKELREEIEERKEATENKVAVVVRNDNDDDDDLKNNDCGIYGCIDENIDFEGFNNETGADSLIVPDIVHLLYLQQTQLKFYHVINIFSIYYNHKPGLIYIHCDNCSFHGKYWEWIKDEPGLFNLIKLHQIPYHNTIFGIKYGWINHHRSDIWRLQVLMNYGGIYLDNDMYIIHPLHKYRKFELVTTLQGKNDGLGVQVYIAHKNARFLKTHFDSYRHNYTRGSWYWNAGYGPAEIIKQYPYLAHVVPLKLGTRIYTGNIFRRYWPEWKTDFDSLHLLINHRHYLDKDSPIKEFDEFNILNYNYTYGEMARDIMKKMGKL